MTTRRTNKPVPLVASLCEGAAAFLAMCVFSTLTVGEIFALQTHHDVAAGGIGAGDHLWLHHRSSIADGRPLERQTNSPVSRSILSVPARSGGEKKQRQRRAQRVTDLKAEFLDMSFLPGVTPLGDRLKTAAPALTTDMRKEFKSMIESQTQTVGEVSDAIRGVMEDVSESVAGSLVTLSSLGPVAVATTSDELRRNIEDGGAALIDAVKLLAQQVTQAAEKANILMVNVITGKHEKYKVAQVLKKWRDRARGWVKAKAAKLRRTGASIKARIRDFMSRRRRAKNMAEDEGASTVELAGEAPPTALM